MRLVTFEACDLQKVFEFGGARLCAPERGLAICNGGIAVFKGEDRISQTAVQFGLDGICGGQQGQCVLSLLTLLLQCQ